MKKQLTREYLLDGWLKYHNTNTEKLIKKHPKEVLQNLDWFKLYPITHEQLKEWEVWAKNEIHKATKYPKKYIDRKWGFIYLDIAPNTIKNESL